VLRAAVKIADERGIEALTMRRLAEEVGAEAMSLYHHVANKDEVLDGVVDVIIQEINEVVGGLGTPARGADWKKAMRERILSGPGDEVVALLPGGGFGEYVTVKEDLLTRKPHNLSYEQAAAVPMAGVTALLAVRDEGRVRPGQAVLINGASGGVGTFAVQIAKAFGAKVAAVCSGANADLVRSIGADEVIDYRTEDFTRAGPRFDLMLDVAGSRPVPAAGGR
jgi:AcrR family transcriptional regulator